MLPKLDDIALAIDGVITTEQASKLLIIKKHFDNLNICKSDLENLIYELAKVNNRAELLSSIEEEKNIIGKKLDFPPVI